MLLLSDDASQRADGRAPAFPEEERRYLVEAIRHVTSLALVEEADLPDALPSQHAAGPSIWAEREAEDTTVKRAFCAAAGLDYVIIGDAELRGFPESATEERARDRASRQKVLVTGCFDWLHSGHVRFFEEVAELGDLYAIVGNDRSVELLKGSGHPMYPEEERRYMVWSIRHVKQALVTSGMGWLDAEPEVELIRPDLWVVNEDGDRPEKREYCEAHGIEYRILRRRPRDGLPIRRSVDLRGF